MPSTADISSRGFIALNFKRGRMELRYERKCTSRIDVARKSCKTVNISTHIRIYRHSCGREFLKNLQGS